MNILGIDVGGMSIKGAIVNDKGEMKDPFVYPINKKENQFECIESLLKVIDRYLVDQNIRIDGIGLGIPGSIDTKRGKVVYSNNLLWEDLPIVELFSKHFNLPIRITNDANAAALGEARFGAGKDYSDIVMITLGTGVGSGIVINNELFEGGEGKGAEIGHSLLVIDGLPCTCGRKGCFEQYASATALIRMTRESMDQNPGSIMHLIAVKEGGVNGKVAFMAAKENDKAALEVVDKYIHYLSEGLLNVCNIFRPEAIVLSGGISKEGKYLTDKIQSYLEAQSYGYPLSPRVEILTSKLGYNSGIIGAASLLMNI